MSDRLVTALRTRLVRPGTILWTAFVALLLVLALPYYRGELGRIRNDKLNTLRVVADLKIRRIHAWRSQRLADARWSSRSPLFRREVLALIQDGEAPGIPKLLTERFALERQERGYAQVMLLDAWNRVLLASTAQDRTIGPETRVAIEQARQSKDDVVGPLFRCSCGKIHLDTIAPVLDGQGVVRATVVLRVDPHRELFPLVQSWPIPSASAETLLVARDGSDVLFLNELRHRKNTALSFRIPVAQIDLPAAKAVMETAGMVEGNDYRGIPVQAYVAPIPGSPWFMVAKVDSREIFAEARYRAGVIVGAVLLLACLGWVAIAWVRHRGQAMLFRVRFEGERQRREAEQEFRATLYSIGDAVITTDGRGAIRQMNVVAERLTAWTESEAKKRPVTEVFRIVNEETRKPAENPVDRVLRDGAIVGLANHTLLIARDGRECPIADSAAPIRDGGEDVKGMVLVFRDQTAERLRQQRVEHLLRVLRAIRRVNQLIVRARSPKFLIENVCNLLIEDRGYRGSWVVLEDHGEPAREVAVAGRTKGPLADVLRSLSHPGASSCLARVMQLPDEFLVTNPSRDCRGCPLFGCFGEDVMMAVVTLRHADHVYGFLGISVERDPDDEERGLIVETASDISFALHAMSIENRHQMISTELATRGEMLNIVAEGIGLSRAGDGVLVYANPAFERMFGYATGELFGRALFSLTEAGQFAVDWKAVAAAIEAHGQWSADVCARRKDGSTFWCNCTISAWTHPKHGQVWISLHRDITARRELENQYRQAQKMEAVGQLAGGVAHDFNNILAALTMQVNMLQADSAQSAPEDLPKRLSEMLATTGRASSLTRQLLLFSRRQAMVKATHDLNLVIGEMGRLLGRVLGERIRLVVEVATTPLWVVGDQSMLEQVVMNLAVNARDAMPQGGQIEMLCDQIVLSDEQAGAIRGGRPGRYARLRMVDTGQGMTSEVLTHLFEPFFTTKEQGRGTGLGLATVQSIVSQHQGFVAVQSDEGKGSTFSVFIPMAAEGALPVSRPHTNAVGGNGERVLLVEDEAPLCKLAQKALTRLGYHVTCASSAEEALSVWHSSRERFALVLTDMVTPGPLSGLDLCRELAGTDRNLRLIITSGYSLDLARESEALPPGVIFLPKPYDMRTLATAVRGALERGGAPEQAATSFSSRPGSG
jgi:PAS domain S-box-containing protein